MIATSGRASWTAASSASASPALATISWPGVGEQAREPLAEQRRVLADHDAHGTTASTVVPCPASLPSASAPPTASTRSLSPASPEPGVQAWRRLARRR